MTIRVTMLKNGFDQYGNRLTAGVTYSLPDEFAKSLILSLQAIDTDGVLQSPGNTPFDVWPLQNQPLTTDQGSGLGNAPSSVPVYKIAGAFYPKGSTSADIQAALDWLVSRGGGDLQLVPHVTYSMTSNVTIDVSYCGLEGQNNLLDASAFVGSGPVISLTSSTTGSNQYQQVKRIGGFTLRGDSVQDRDFPATGIYAHSDVTPSSVRALLSKVQILNFTKGISVKSNAYFLSGEDVDVYRCKFDLYQESGATNFAEGIAFIRCRFFNSDCYLKDVGGNQWKFKHCSFDYFGDATGGRITADDRMFHLALGAVVKLDDCHLEWEYGDNAGHTNIPIYLTGNNTKFICTGGKWFKAGGGNPYYSHLIRGDSNSQLVHVENVELRGLGRVGNTTSDDCLVAGSTPATSDGTGPRVIMRNLSSVSASINDMPSVPALCLFSAPNRNGVDDPYTELLHRIVVTGTAAIANVSAAENGISLGRYGAGKMLKITGQGKVIITLPVYEPMRRHGWMFFLNSGFVTGSFTVRERQTTFVQRFDGTTVTTATDARAFYSPTTVTITGGTNAWERVSWKRCNSDANPPMRMNGVCFSIEIDTTSMSAGALYLDDFAFGLM